MTYPPGLSREKYWSCLPPWQGRFSHLKCPSPNLLSIRDDFLGPRRVRLQLEWVDPQECREGFKPCQFIVTEGDTFREAFSALGAMMDLIREKGTRFEPPKE